MAKGDMRTVKGGGRQMNTGKKGFGEWKIVPKTHKMTGGKKK